MKMELNFSKEKRAELQKQAYGKVYAYCNNCFNPLIPTSKIPTDNHKRYTNQFIKCCENSLVLFGEEYEINMLKYRPSC